MKIKNNLKTNYRKTNRYNLNKTQFKMKQINKQILNNNNKKVKLKYWDFSNQ